MAVTNFTYDSTLADTASWVRFTLQDNVSPSAILDDNEIAAIVAQGGPRELIAAQCADAMQAKLIQAVDRSVVGLSASGRAAMADKMQLLAKELRQRVGETSELCFPQGGQSKAEKEADAALTDQVQPSFSRDMWTNT